MTNPPPAAGIRTLAEIRGRIAFYDSEPTYDPLGHRRSRLLSALPLTELEQHLPAEKIADADFRTKWGQTPPEEQVQQVLGMIAARAYDHLDSLMWLLGDAEHRAWTSIPSENVADRITFVARLAAPRS